MPQTLGSLPNGALVKDLASTYLGVPVIFRKAATNHTGYPTDSVTLITDRIITIKAFDAREAGNANADRAASGGNRYRTSNIRQWLNSLGAANSWWVAQNLTDGVVNTNNRDAAPTQANTNNQNGYDTEAGFLTNFSTNFRDAILPTALTVARNTATDGGGSETVTDHFFLASNTEVGLANENNIAEGALLPIFTIAASRIAFQTQQAINQSNATTTAIGNAWHWLLRSPMASMSRASRLVHSDTGNLSFDNQNRGTMGIRPLCNLESEILVSDTPDTDGAYILIFVQPPTIPQTIDAPAQIMGGSNPVISWGLSTDPQGQAVTYVLERSINSGAWTAIFTGIGRTFADNIAFGVATAVQYRVRARNVSGAYSDNRTSGVITVINNTPPSIDGADAYLGEKVGAFSFNYTVTDPDPGAVITVTESLNGEQLRQYTAQTGAAQTLEVSTEQFIQLPNAPSERPHTLEIVATDEWGASDIRTLTFSRSEYRIELTKAEPHPANVRPTRAAVTVLRSIPDGATFQVLICNNAFDDNPTWEDCTESVTSGGVYTFTNETKIAETWGVSVQVLVNRNGASGLCFISSVGGNFE